MNPFRSLLGLILGSALVLAFAAAGPGVWWYDRHFPGWDWRGPVFGWPAIQLAPGIAVADAKVIADGRVAFGIERASLYRAYAAITAQNASIAGLKTAAAAWQAKGRAAEDRAARVGAQMEAQAGWVLGLPEPADQSPLGKCRAAEAVLRGAAQ